MDARARTMLAALCGATFLVTGAGVAMAPFLLVIAGELAVDLAALGNLLALQNVAWGVVSLVAGAGSDRLGRRPILIGGLLAMGAGRLGFAGAHGEAAAAGWMALTGVGGGAFMSTVYAAVSDHVASEQRGRALGWVITGQSLSLLAGVPLVTSIGAVWGWRGALASQGAATALVALVVWLAVPPDPPRRPGSPPGAPLAVLARPEILALLGAGTAERICFGAMAVYLAAYLQTSYGVTLAALAVALAVVAMGNVIGNALGASLADRVRSRPRAFAATSVATALLAGPLLAWRPGLAGSVGLGFAYSLVNALGRPALVTTLSEVPVAVRGAVLGANMAMASVGWLAASAVGGWLIARHGFESLGLFCAAAGVAGAVLAVLARPPRRR
jgi:DHA1 family inner membrane transport protein